MYKLSAGLLFPLCFLISGGTLSQQEPPKTSIYEDTTRFSTLEEVLTLRELKNKVVYIDIWGTRCPPCIEQFKYLRALKEKYKGKPVAFLYLKSPYSFDDTKEWKKMIKEYGLEGINISMSINFYNNNFWVKYRDKYSEERSYGIPTYLILNKNGQIVNFDAPGPAKLDELSKLIDEEIR